MPKVTVIIPTFNRAHFLRAAIESVLIQTFRNFEIVVVDDASNDETPSIVRSFRHAPIRYLRHDSKKGQGAARNTGIREARGEYIALLDDDDEWLPEKLEQQVTLLDTLPTRVGLVYTGFLKIDASNRRIIAKILPKERGNVFDALCRENWIGCSTVLVRRHCFDVAGYFDEELASGEDYDMWLRISKEFSFEYIIEPLVSYRVHGSQLSAHYESLIVGMEALIRKHGSFFAANSKSYSLLYLSLGVHYCFKGDLMKGRVAFFRAIKLYPFDIRHYFNLGLSLLGAENFKKLKMLKETVGEPRPVLKL
jgi:glycosyltransferase involved in cell wall biosynthesis